MILERSLSAGEAGLAMSGTPVVVAWTVRGSLDVAVLHRAVRCLSVAHPVLTARLAQTAKGLILRADTTDVPDLSIAAPGFDLADTRFFEIGEPLFRAIIHPHADGSHTVVLVTGHTISDGSCMLALHHLLWSVYTALSEGHRPPAPTGPLALPAAADDGLRSRYDHTDIEAFLTVRSQRGTGPRPAVIEPLAARDGQPGPETGIHLHRVVLDPTQSTALAQRATAAGTTTHGLLCGTLLTAARSLITPTTGPLPLSGWLGSAGRRWAWWRRCGWLVGSRGYRSVSRAVANGCATRRFGRLTLGHRILTRWWGLSTLVGDRVRFVVTSRTWRRDSDGVDSLVHGGVMRKIILAGAAVVAAVLSVGGAVSPASAEIPPDDAVFQISTTFENETLCVTSGENEYHFLRFDLLPCDATNKAQQWKHHSSGKTFANVGTSTCIMINKLFSEGVCAKLKNGPMTLKQDGKGRVFQDFSSASRWFWRPSRNAYGRYFTAYHVTDGSIPDVPSIEFVIVTPEA
ncbi:hypothetical protein [Actinokineospora sp. NBRC 105648]|uniref:hypothetical protein n=1 Tax=Actinokineospora sp. NBRC 105648 TaxID=3032206 RepID=UPI00249FADED|nr:hypothetical protein [Actinokineospora sp. NBRC 105648]GLZ42235.1 hypothetical protein Acsp05_58590 [Actinokineospora sp. NBRC 105648]